MRPLFTIHAGEYVVGDFIEKKYSNLCVWIPSKDTGIDLLVTGTRGHQPVSLQVKLSKDYKPLKAANAFEESIVAAGWLTLEHDKLEKSQADLWVIVLVSHERRMKPQFVVIPPAELLRRLSSTHGKSKKYQVYPWITKSKLCLDVRGLSREQLNEVHAGKMELRDRDLSNYLEKWTSLENMNAASP